MHDIIETHFHHFYFMAHIISLDQQLRTACRENNSEEALQLIENGADPTFNNNTPILWAVKNSNYSLATHLMDHINLDNWISDYVFVLLEQIGTADSVFLKQIYPRYQSLLQDDQKYALFINQLKTIDPFYLFDNETFNPPPKIIDLFLIKAAATGAFDVFERILALKHDKTSLPNVVWNLASNNKHDLIQKTVPLLSYGDDQRQEIALIFMQYPTDFAIMEPYIPKTLLQESWPLLRMALDLPYDRFLNVMNKFVFKHHIPQAWNLVYENSDVEKTEFFIENYRHVLNNISTSDNQTWRSNWNTCLAQYEQKRLLNELKEPMEKAPVRKRKV